jgi:hypothetical protein
MGYSVQVSGFKSEGQTKEDSWQDLQDEAL